MEPTARRRPSTRLGRKEGEVPTLVELCQATLRVNIHGMYLRDLYHTTNLIFPYGVALTDLGDVPYELVEPVLVCCTAEQLLDLEDTNVVSG